MATVKDSVTGASPAPAAIHLSTPSPPIKSRRWIALLSLGSRSTSARACMPAPVALLSHCHGSPHAIRPAKDPQATTFRPTCRTCGAWSWERSTGEASGAQGSLFRLHDSIHGFALTKDGLLVAANCSSCHGSHGILSSKDPKSKTNHANIPATCGTCHTGPSKLFPREFTARCWKPGRPMRRMQQFHTAHQISKRHYGISDEDHGQCGAVKRRLATTHTFHHRSLVGFNRRRAAGIAMRA